MKWYEGWEVYFEKKPTLHERAFIEILDRIGEFKKEAEEKGGYRVLNAMPGHGKTTALKVFVKKMLESREPFGGLIVLREKEQMKAFEKFAADGNEKGLLYIDADNLPYVQKNISDYQFVLITHERLKNIATDEGSTKANLYTTWNEKKRAIIIDEAPTFVNSMIFELGQKLDWLDDCFSAAPNVFSSEEIIMVRSLIQMLFAKELLENKEKQTRALQIHNDGIGFSQVLTNFFRNVDYHIDRISSPESSNAYTWFKKLYFESGTGYIDNGLYIEGYADHKKIICSRRIDYRKLSSSILILDGTAGFTPRIYNNEFDMDKITNHTSYERLSIYQRIINTSARKRKEKKELSVQKLIANDIETIKAKEGSAPFLLTHKSEINQYRKLNVINATVYKMYYDFRTMENALPINLLNTIGKNYLENQKSLYLTALPNRPAHFYKAIALSLYKEPLNLSMNEKDKHLGRAWFADDRIEAIYRECLLAELFQIIHRSNIRNLLRPSSDKVNIYIATKSDHILDELQKMLGYQCEIMRDSTERTMALRHQLREQVSLAAEKIKNESIKLPCYIGKLEEGAALKNLVNKNWNDSEKRDIIVSVFNDHKLNISEQPNKRGKMEKKVSRCLEMKRN